MSDKHRSSNHEYSPLLTDQGRNSVGNQDNGNYDGFDDWTSDRFTCTRLRTPAPAPQTSAVHQLLPAAFDRSSQADDQADHSKMGFIRRLWRELWAFKRTVLFVLIPLLASPLLIVIGDNVSGM